MDPELHSNRQLLFAHSFTLQFFVSQASPYPSHKIPLFIVCSEKQTLRSFGDQNDHDFIQSQPAGSNCFETKQCQNVKQYNHDCFDCQRNARRICHWQVIMKHRQIKFEKSFSPVSPFCKVFMFHVPRAQKNVKSSSECQFRRK